MELSGGEGMKVCMIYLVFCQDAEKLMPIRTIIKEGRREVGRGGEGSRVGKEGRKAANKGWGGCGKTGTLTHCWWNVK